MSRPLFPLPIFLLVFILPLSLTNCGLKTIPKESLNNYTFSKRFSSVARKTLRSNGLSEEEINQWMAYASIKEGENSTKGDILTIGEVVDWEKAGFKFIQAYPWLVRRGIRVEEASLWKKAGFITEDALTWINDFRNSPEEAIQWKNSGLSPNEAHAYHSRSVSLENALKWRASGFTLDEACDWIDGVSNPSQKINSDVALKWKTSNITMKQAVDWNNAIGDPDTARLWVDSGFSPTEAMAFKANNVSLVDARQLRQKELKQARLQKQKEEKEARLQKQEKEKQERLQRQEEEKRIRNEPLLIVKAVSEYRLRKAAYDQMNYELKYKTLSNDIQRKSEEIYQYAKETLKPAFENMAYYISEYGKKYGAGALRDLAIKNGFIDLLSHEQ